MKMSTRQIVVLWGFPVAALLLAGLASGGWNAWLWYAIAGVALGAVAAGVGSRAIAVMTRTQDPRKSVLVVAFAGWVFIGGLLVTVNMVTEGRISWAVYPALGLAMWPLGAWLYPTGER